MNAGDYDWADFFPGEQAVATVDGRVLGVPALVDNLAVVYNKDLFAAAGVPEPTADWTWDDLRAAAAATTDPANKVFGLSFPVDGSETTVWQYIAMLWAAGGDILNADNTEATFNSEAGGARADHADRDPAGRLDVPRLPARLRQVRAAVQLRQDRDDHHRPVGPVRRSPTSNYGVQVMPSFDPGGSHETIAGPDNWVIFDNGQERVEAAWKFLSFMTSPEQVLQDALDTSHLPIRASVSDMPEFQAFFTDVPRHRGVRGEPEQRAEGAPADPAVPADLHRARAGHRERPPGGGHAAGGPERGGRTVSNGYLAIPG